MNQGTRTIAVPSDAPGGLEAKRSGHFGHADSFTLVTVTDGVPAEIRVLGNPHETGGCLSPVAMLADEGADAITVAGIGGRPLAALRQVGITVYLDSESRTVADAVAAVTAGAAATFGDEHACGGHSSGGCGGH
jgi:predicted Fe-Mo cluster-binding NifX family protein